MTLTTLSLVLGVLLGCWFAWSFLVGRELVRGEKLFLVNARHRLDRGVERLQVGVEAVVHYLDRHIIRLSWYYSLHSFLKAALRVVVSLYDYLERRFHSNRMRARAIRAERRAMKRGKEAGSVTIDPHLASIAEHKAEVALSTKQKQKLKTKTLERG
jgi:hypothetical protein